MQYKMMISMRAIGPAATSQGGPALILLFASPANQRGVILTRSYHAMWSFYVLNFHSVGKQQT